MYVQIMTEEQAQNHYENPFDITKIWRHGEYPLIEVGVLELNRNPENFFAEVEQAAFTPAHVVPASAFRPTGSCRAACLPTATPSATAWASTTT